MHVQNVPIEYLYALLSMESINHRTRKVCPAYGARVHHHKNDANKATQISDCSIFFFIATMPPVSSSTVAVGIDLGSANARIATYDTNLKHPVVCANHDGHRETRVVWSTGDEEPEAPVLTVDALRGFYEEKLLALATSSAHTKDLSIVTSISNDLVESEWIEMLQSFGSVITEAAAICVAYQVDPSKYARVLVLDGGASALKATVLTHINGLWKQEQFTKLDSIRGSALVEPLAQAVAQQFEQTHRFPRCEVWASKRARAKLLRACEQSLSSFQRLANVAIHVDGLYEGMDCNVSISKPKWEHISSKLATQVKSFCQSLVDVDTVLIAGNLHDWMTPIVKSTLGADKVHVTSLDPSEVVALGCTLQSYWNLQQQRQDSQTPHPHPTLPVPCCPIAIAIKGSGETQVLIDKGTPLPCQVEYEVTEETLDLLQLLPQQKPLAKLEELETSTTLYLQLSAQGRLRIQVNGESLVIG